MDNNEIPSIDEVSTVHTLVRMVNMNKDNYPVVDDQNVLVGDISECLLLKLMNQKVYNTPRPLPQYYYQ